MLKVSSFNKYVIASSDIYSGTGNIGAADE